MIHYIMELLLISPVKLKVMLTRADMEAYSISCDELDYDNTETRRAFWSILDEAKHKTGFDAAHDRVFIQVYPGRTGGCEMFITRLSEGEKPDDGICCQIPEDGHTVSDIWCFMSLELLLAACRCLRDIGFCDESEAWYSEGTGAEKKYFLILSSPPSPRRRMAAYPMLGEYGHRRESGDSVSYIKEHGECICAVDAVLTLSALAL